MTLLDSLVAVLAFLAVAAMGETSIDLASFTVFLLDFIVGIVGFSRSWIEDVSLWELGWSEVKSRLGIGFKTLILYFLAADLLVLITNLFC